MEYDVTVTQQELQLIFQALGELPLKVSVNLFSRLQNEMIRQDNEKALSIDSIITNPKK